MRKRELSPTEKKALALLRLTGVLINVGRGYWTPSGEKPNFARHPRSGTGWVGTRIVAALLHAKLVVPAGRTRSGAVTSVRLAPDEVPRA